MLGEFIYERRRRMRISRAELARLITQHGYDCTESAINHWENNRSEVPIEDPILAKALSSALNVSPSDLLKASGLLVALSEDDLKKVFKRFSPLTLQLLEEATPKDIKRLDLIIQALFIQDI